MTVIEFIRQLPVYFRLLLILLFTAAGLLPFESLAPNRLLSGVPFYLTDVLSVDLIFLVLVIGGLLLLAFLPGRLPVFLTLLTTEMLFASLLWWCGEASREIAIDASRLARVSPGSGLWLMLSLALIMFSDAVQRLLKRGLWRGLVILQILAIPLVLISYGWFDSLSLLKEYENRHDTFHQALGQHLRLVILTLVPALLFSVPLGLWCYYRPEYQPSTFAVLSVIQTVPAIALFGLLMVPLAELASAIPLLSQWGISGTGLAHALIALVLYALLPLVRGVVAGLKQVPHEVIENARAMGIKEGRIVINVQVPLALPVLLCSLRVVAIQTVGMAVIAALIGAGGLGTLIFQGVMSSALDLVLLGVIPVIMLAVKEGD